MTERTKDLLKQAGAIAMVFLSGGTAMMNLYLYRFPATHANAYEGSLGKMVFAILLAFVFGWLAIRPRKRSTKVGVEVPIRLIEGGTRIADAEGRVFITTEDVDIGGSSR